MAGVAGSDGCDGCGGLVIIVLPLVCGCCSTQMAVVAAAACVGDPRVLSPHQVGAQRVA